MRKTKTHTNYKLHKELISVGFKAFKDVLPALTTYTLKTDNNAVIIGKWHKSRR